MVTGLPHPQQSASHHARTGGAVSSQAAATAPQGGRETPARQVRRGPPVRPGRPSDRSVLRGLSVGAAACLTPPFPQTWTSAVSEGAAAPSTVSTPRVATGARVGRATAHAQTGCSACPREGPPRRPRAPPEVNSRAPPLRLGRDAGLGRDTGGSPAPGPAGAGLFPRTGGRCREWAGAAAGPTRAARRHRMPLATGHYYFWYAL